jgi:cell division septation protein DedD
VPKNDDGEFELILGNKQLLGVFFIVIVLLAVFFTMGYIVGRNSAPLIAADTSARKPDVKPLVVDSAAPKEDGAPATSTPAPEPAAKQPENPAPAVKKEKPPEKPAPVKKEEPAKPEPKKESPRPGPLSSQPEQGKTYLQLVATGKPDADAMADLLRKNGFMAFDYEVVERPGLYRVMVGPVLDSGINKLRADLQAKSFPGDHAIKKSF